MTIPLSDVDWGPTDASVSDGRFSAKWVEPPEIRACLDNNCWLVTGEKGSGKSAIQRAIREIYSSSFFVTPLVDFDQIKFGPLYHNLIQLSDTTKLSASQQLSNYWQYSIVVELMAACARKDHYRYGDLLKAEPTARHHNLSLPNRLTQLAEEAWNWIENFTRNKQANDKSYDANLLASGGLSSNDLHSLSIFPAGPEFNKVRLDFFARLAENGHRATLILDGFDSLVTKDINVSSVHLIFSSLVDAILSLRKNDGLPPSIAIKALIPHDRFMNLGLRDSDKVDAFHTAIRWTPEALKEFVSRRIILTEKIKNKQGHFQSLWRQIMPESVMNTFHKIEEDSFDYILRHTMLRPRQLQIHLNTLATSYSQKEIVPSMIPKSIAESNGKLAKFFITEFELDHPYLERLIASFERKPNVMKYEIFRDHVMDGIRYVLGADHQLKIEDAVDALYALGLFGTVRFMEQGEQKRDRYYPPSKDGSQHYVDFFFRSPNTKISSRLKDDTLIALHPIFVDHANLRPDSSLIIG